MIPRYPKGFRSLSFARRLRALVMSEKDCFTLPTIVLFEVIVAKAACLDSSLGDMEHQISHSIACWQGVEKTWSTPMMEAIKYLLQRDLIKGGRERPRLRHLSNPSGTYHFCKSIPQLNIGF